VWKEIFKASLLAILILSILLLAVSLWMSSTPTTYQPWIIGTADPPGSLSESFVVQVNGSPVRTARRYAGDVVIIFRGERLIDPIILRDAFYVYEPNSYYSRRFVFENTILDGKPITSYDFFVTGRVSSGTLYMPELNVKHEYRLLHDVGTELHNIELQMINEDARDHSTFMIEVSIDNTVSPPGR
jgi:hypothetical protein